MARQSLQQRALFAVIALVAGAMITVTLTASFHWVNKPFPGFFLHENLTVGPYSLPRWSGNQAGLKPFDLITAVNGRPLTDRASLYELARSAPPATRFTYTVVRDERSFSIGVASMRFSFYDWFLSFGLFVLIGLAFLIIGAAPCYFGANSPAARFLCLMGIAVFLWFETTFDFMTSGRIPKELRHLAITITPSLGIHLAFILRGREALQRWQRSVLAAVYAGAVLLAVLNSLTFFGPPETWMWAFRAEYLYACLGALAFLAILWRALEGDLADLTRSRLRVMFAGALIGFLVPTMAAVLTSSLRWSIPYNLALIPTLFFPLSVAYALLKYTLFDLGHAFKLSVSRLTLTVFLLALYLAVVVAVGSSLGGDESDPLIPLFFSVLVVLLFNPALRRIERTVDRYIYRQEYDAGAVQEEISLYLRSLATARWIANGFVRLTSERLGLHSAGLVYRPKGAQEILAAGAADSAADHGAIAGGMISLWERLLGGRYQILSRGEVAGDPRFARDREEILRTFDALRAELFIPIVFEREIRGFAWFGAKRSGNEYSAEDLRLLGTLTDQLALSLENGRLFEESVQAQEEYRQLYNSAEIANKRLIENDRLKKQFVANLCHELRTPVSTIIGYAEILLDPAFRGDRRPILERLVQNGQDLSQLMDNLLDFSRIEAGALFNRCEPVKVQEILRALELMTQRLIRGRPIEFKTAIEPQIEVIHSDPRKLQQILTQLLTNALKFTHRGRIELRLRLRSEADLPLLEISV
ncbi:MAG TPA: histidine kinase dimerization/phospho-acceptor domain-containing protein, partial [Candidatus Eisenbacteria bacterium]|nr:histidine kinase dimerization/phospho-acceptor domain-containing protein [Candidatus Eisenbacteria bacterium]